MQKSNIKGSTDKREVNPDWFTNKTWMKVLSEKIKSKDQDIYHVHFENGSKTKLHFHNGNQVLIGIKGKGRLEIFKRYGSNKAEFKIYCVERINLNVGDIVHIPSKTLHTVLRSVENASLVNIITTLALGKLLSYASI